MKVIKSLLNNFRTKPKKLFKDRRSWALGILFLILIALGAAKSLFLSALVNGQPIFRFSVIKQLESQGGGPVLDSLIEKSLILQEARKQGIKVTNEELDSEIERIRTILKEQNLTLEDALADRGETLAGVKEQIEIQKIVESVLGGNISISDEKLLSYFEENKEFYGDDANFEELKEEIRQQIFQEELMAQYTSWIAKLKSEAKIYYFVNYN
jgi:foldase protein PrsA